MEQAAGSDPLIGAKVGNYEVRHKLGEGGMGSVYMAEHPLIGKQVALKVLHAEFASNEDVVSRFFNEAKAVNDIQHPNIVDIIDYGTIRQSDGSSMVYFIMEFLAGKSLSQLIHEEAPLAPERALRIAIQTADALGASHRANIVHRDLKPDNIIMESKRHEPDFVKVLDFGIAKLTGDQPGSRRTRTGIVMGTPAYMSPEQCEGRGEVDHRTDVYALGILVYEMLTGKVPFEGEGYGEVLVQHLTQPPARPTAIRGIIPPHIEAVCLRALEKRPVDRYPSMDEFIRALTDPVGYVEASGGVDFFTSANLGAPQPTPYPANPSPLTPLPGQLAPVTPTPMPQHPPTWPTPMPTPVPQALQQPAQSQLPLFLLGLIAVAGLIIGGVFLFGKDDEQTANAGSDSGTGESDGSGTADDGAKNGSGEDTGGSDEGTAAVAVVIDAGVPVPVAVDASVAPDTTVEMPTTVEVSITSRPNGARVFIRGTRKSIGTTPMVHSFKIAKKRVELVLKRRKYEDLELKVELDENVTLDVPMVERRRRGGNGKTNSNSKGNGKGSGSGTGYKDPNETLKPTFGNGN